MIDPPLSEEERAAYWSILASLLDGTNETGLDAEKRERALANVLESRKILPKPDP